MRCMLPRRLFVCIASALVCLSARWSIAIARQRAWWLQRGQTGSDTEAASASIAGSPRNGNGTVLGVEYLTLHAASRRELCLHLGNGLRLRQCGLGEKAQRFGLSNDGRLWPQASPHLCLGTGVGSAVELRACSWPGSAMDAWLFDLGRGSDRRIRLRARPDLCLAAAAEAPIVDRALPIAGSPVATNGTAVGDAAAILPLCGTPIASATVVSALAAGEALEAWASTKYLRGPGKGYSWRPCSATDERDSSLRGRCDTEKSHKVVAAQNNAESLARNGGVAVYTYIIGGYDDLRPDRIPCVPPSVDAFLFIGGTDSSSVEASRLLKWRQQGWQVKDTQIVPGNQFVSPERLTVKLLKFRPPPWLLQGAWDWLVTFDSNMAIGLKGLPAFLSSYGDRPLLLLNWNKGHDGWSGFDQFRRESHYMLHEHPQYTATSRENCIEWRRKLVRLHANKSSGFSMPYYYDLSILFRNLKHASAPRVQSAFTAIFAESHRIQRDQFLMPYFLWQFGLVEATAPLPLRELQGGPLHHCFVTGARRGRN